ncbi:hypothetical protein A7M54_16285 [Acinetobacter nosocomialis]|nr:hypothetical protein [Acinetobacter sp.]OIC71614.1 hypothetical protein A7L14_12695 [Acinetobacter nosocomialis]OID39469.1 hypothetical protein A7L09_00830 [Acinetobacter nosocomialis]OIG55486.1 hypothetical protein A7M54_16285 [Acinetobacter nosocomialis]OIG59192.1 hypothetical protein A7M62_00350 [Acinetobacter nosocomialis]
MCKANSFLLGVLPDIKIMVAERKGVSRLAEKTQHTRRCPPPVPPQRGHEGSSLKDCSFNAFRNGLLKPTGNVASRQRIVSKSLVVKHTK